MLTRSFILVLFGVLTAAISNATFAAGKSTRAQNDTYDIQVAGVVKGTGHATVSGDKISLQATVKNADGVSGDLIADSLTLKGSYITGTGSVIGQEAKFKGRLDNPVDENEKTLKGVRMSITFSTKDGHYGRVVGYIPSYAKAKDDPSGSGKDDSGKDASPPTPPSDPKPNPPPPSSDPKSPPVNPPSDDKGGSGPRDDDDGPSRGDQKRDGHPRSR